MPRYRLHTCDLPCEPCYVKCEALLFTVAFSSLQDAQAENAGQSLCSERRLKVHVGARPAPPPPPPPNTQQKNHPKNTKKNKTNTKNKRSKAHSNTKLVKPFFFQSTRTYTECCVFFLIYFFLTFKLRVQPTQPQPLCWKSVRSRTFSCLCCKILLLRNVTGFSVMMCSLFDKCTLLVAFAAYLCNHLFMLL